MLNINDEVIHKITNFQGRILNITETNLFVISDNKGNKKIVPEKEIELIRRAEKEIKLYPLPVIFSLSKYRQYGDNKC